MPSRKNSLIRKNVVRGVTGLAVTAGAIAVGAALSNRKNRELVKKGAKGALKRVTQMARSFTPEEINIPIASRTSKSMRRSASVAHRVSPKRRGRKSGRRGR